MEDTPSWKRPNKLQRMCCQRIISSLMHGLDKYKEARKSKKVTLIQELKEWREENVPGRIRDVIEEEFELFSYIGLPSDFLNMFKWGVLKMLFMPKIEFEEEFIKSLDFRVETDAWTLFNVTKILHKLDVKKLTLHETVIKRQVLFDRVLMHCPLLTHFSIVDTITVPIARSIRKHCVNITHLSLNITNFKIEKLITAFLDLKPTDLYKEECDKPLPFKQLKYVEFFNDFGSYGEKTMRVAYFLLLHYKTLWNVKVGKHFTNKMTIEDFIPLRKTFNHKRPFIHLKEVIVPHFKHIEYLETFCPNIKHLHAYNRDRGIQRFFNIPSFNLTHFTLYIVEPMTSFQSEILSNSITNLTLIFDLPLEYFHVNQFLSLFPNLDKCTLYYSSIAKPLTVQQSKNLNLKSLFIFSTNARQTSNEESLLYNLIKYSPSLVELNARFLSPSLALDRICEIVRHATNLRELAISYQNYENRRNLSLRYTHTVRNAIIETIRHLPFLDRFTLHYSVADVLRMLKKHYKNTSLVFKFSDQHCFLPDDFYVIKYE